MTSLRISRPIRNSCRFAVRRRQSAGGEPQSDSCICRPVSRLPIRNSPLSSTLKTEVVLNPVRLTIRSTVRSPPVKHLDSLWRFHAIQRAAARWNMRLTISSRAGRCNCCYRAWSIGRHARCLAAFEARARELYEGSLARGLRKQIKPERLIISKAARSRRDGGFARDRLEQQEVLMAASGDPFTAQAR